MSDLEQAIVEIHAQNQYSKTKLLETTNAVSSTFYEHQKPKSPTKRDQEDLDILDKMQKFIQADEFNNSYGVSRLKDGLAECCDIHIGNHRTLRLMQKLDYQSVIVRSYKGKRGRPVVERDNLIKDLDIAHPYQVLATDVTYLIRPGFGRLYKASVIDWHTGDIVGSVTGYDMTTNLTKRALKVAVDNIKSDLGFLPDDIILHSDNGTHFTATDYEDLAASFGFVRSYSRPGHPEENAIIENYHSFFKTEFFNPRKHWRDADLILGAARYDTWWNTKRISTKTRRMKIPATAA